MMNVMEIKGYQAVIQYDPEIERFRGEFIGLNGGADFYAEDTDSLRKEGEISLQVFLDMCREDSVDLRKEFSGKNNADASTGSITGWSLRGNVEGIR